MSLWKKLPWSARATVPQLPGVYAIYADVDPTKVIYIGQSNNLFSRLRQHGNAWPPLSNFKYKLSTRTGEWLMWEHRLIARLKPPKNKAIPGKYRTMAGRWKSLPQYTPKPKARKMTKEEKEARRRTRQQNKFARDAHRAKAWAAMSDEQKAKFQAFRQQRQLSRSRR